ncbi:MAG: TldD/PmbA family protein [Christensenellales bacterium]|jgi:PmbA protein
MNMELFLQKLFARAAEAGFEASEAYIAGGESFEASIFQGEVNNLSASADIGLGFRALINGKMGYASTQVFDEDAISFLIEGARTNALLIEDEDKQEIFAGSASYPDAEYYNPALDALTAAEKLDMLRALEKATLSVDPRISSTQECSIFSTAGSRRIVNSMGLDVSSRDNAIGAFTAPVARDGEKVNSGAEASVSRDVSAIDIEKIAKKACEEALAGLDAKSVQSGKYKIVFHRDTAGALLRTFSDVFSADAAQKGLSLLKGREGEKIASDVVTIVDDPLLKEGRVFARFDGEGVACFRKAVVENGVLKTLLHNLKTAAKQGVKTTGNASRSGYAGQVNVSCTNFFIENGDASFDDLLREANDGILITELMGMHSGANGITGDFSLGAKGFQIEDGKIASPVNQITVAGNFFTWLKSISRVGNDLAFDRNSVSSPSLYAGEMSVAGSGNE